MDHRRARIYRASLRCVAAARRSRLLNRKEIVMRFMLTLFVCSLAAAQNIDRWTGHWEGSIESPRQSYPVEIDFAKNAKGELEGAQGPYAMKLEFKNDYLRFAAR